MTKPSSEIDVEIQSQKFTIKYPNSGQIIDIATLKAKLSDGQYTQLILQRSNESGISLKLIDAFSFFTITIPQLRDNLNTRSLYDLELLQSIELIHVYENVVIPWLEDWTNLINEKIEEFDKKSDSKRQLV